MRAVWRRIQDHLRRVPRGVPQIYGAIIAVLIGLILIWVDPRTFGINWTSVAVFIGLNAVFAMANYLYRRSKSEHASNQ